MIAIDRVRWDRLGVVGSAACMVHCLALPLLVPLLPLMAGIAESEVVHKGLLFLLAACALAAFWPGYRMHRAMSVVVSATAGVVLLAAAVLAEEMAGMPGLDKPLTVLGGVVLIAAHALNIKLCRACPVCRTEAAQEA